MSRAHIGDEAVADRLVESDGETPLVAATRGDDPQPLQKTRVEPVGGDERDHVAARRPGRRGEVETTDQLRTPTRKVDYVQVQRPLQVGIGLRVARDDELGAVWRPIEPGDIPGSAGQLRNVAAGRRHYEEMVVAAVCESLAVVLVVETACDSGDGCSPQLISAFRRPGIVHDRIRVAHDRADESNLDAIVDD